MIGVEEVDEGLVMRFRRDQCDELPRRLRGGVILEFVGDLALIKTDALLLAKSGVEHEVVAGDPSGPLSVSVAVR